MTKDRLLAKCASSAILLGFVCCLWAASPDDAQAIGNLKLGPFTVHPYITTDVNYSDNVTRVPSNEYEDVYFLIRPGIFLETPRDDRKLRFLYEMEVEEYLDNDQYKCRTVAGTEVDCSQNAVNHRAEALAHFELASGVVLEASDVYMFTHDERGSNLFIPAPATVVVDEQLARFWDNTIKVGVGYEFADRYRVKVDGAFQDVEYRQVNQKFRNREAVAVKGTFYYRFQPKTTGFLEFDWIDTEYDDPVAAEDLDSTETHYLVGVTWAYRERSSGTLKAGYGIKEFDNQDRPDFEGFIFSATIDHAFDNWTAFHIEGIRQINETSIVTSNYLDTTRVTAELSHQFTGKVAATLFAGYIRDDYSEGFLEVIDDEEVSRDILDETYSLGIELKYDMQDWLAFKAGYRFNTRSSSYDSLEYDENHAYFQIYVVL